MILKVNLLIIGAGRSGTTSLYHYLTQHPNVCFSDIKEVHFFSLKELYERGKQYLESYFTNYAHQKIIATADTYLLMDRKAPERVFDYNPEMKILVLLRDPVERAYSSYHYACNNGYQDPDQHFLLESAKEKERLRKLNIIEQNNLCHFTGSLYYKHLRTWMEYFPKDQFLILTTREMDKNLNATLQKLSSFLAIESFPAGMEEVKVNKAAPVKSRKLQQFLLNRNHPLRHVLRPLVKPLKYLIIKSGIVDYMHGLNKKEQSYMPLSEEERRRAMEFFRDDLKNLRDEFGIDLLE